MEELVEFGKIIKRHGIKGEMVLRSNFEKPENYLQLCFIENGKDLQLFKIVCNGRFPNGDLIITTDAVCKIEDAGHYIGKRLYIEKKLLPKLQDEIYVFDIINFEVFDENGAKIGFVSDVVDFGSGPMIEVQDQETKENLEYLLYNKHTVKNVDLDLKKIIIILPQYV